jgi:hypothetical protein
MSRRETVLNELPGDRVDQRLLVVHVVESSTLASAIELRQQSWAEGLGWYTQSTVRLSPEQLSGLRSVLGNVTAPPAARRRSMDAAISSFRVLRSDSA